MYFRNYTKDSDKLIEFHKIIQKRIKVIENTIDKKKTGEMWRDLLVTG